MDGHYDQVETKKEMKHGKFSKNVLEIFIEYTGLLVIGNSITFCMSWTSPRGSAINKQVGGRFIELWNTWMYKADPFYWHPAGHVKPSDNLSVA